MAEKTGTGQAPGGAQRNRAHMLERIDALEHFRAQKAARKDSAR